MIKYILRAIHKKCENHCVSVIKEMHKTKGKSLTEQTLFGKLVFKLASKIEYALRDYE